MLQLIAHPAHPPLRVRHVAARVLSYDANWCVLRWKVDGAADLVVPPFAGQGRADGLWQTTCFEIFVAAAPAFDPLARAPTPACSKPVEGHAQTSAPQRDCVRGPDIARAPRQALGEQDARGDRQATAYTEFNFSPSERWAAYDFTAYRAGMTERAMPRAPVITPRRGGDVLFCDVAIPTVVLPPLPWRYGMTAVLEEGGGVKSWWALSHPHDKPDFHDPACLGATLAAPIGA